MALIDIPPRPFGTVYFFRPPRLPLDPPEMQRESGPPGWLWWICIGLLIGSPLWVAVGAILVLGIRR